MRLAIPDLISNSYFPAVAAVEEGKVKAVTVNSSTGDVQGQYNAADGRTFTVLDPRTMEIVTSGKTRDVIFGKKIANKIAEKFANRVKSECGDCGDGAPADFGASPISRQGAKAQRKQSRKLSIASRRT